MQYIPHLTGPAVKYLAIEFLAPLSFGQIDHGVMPPIL